MHRKGFLALYGLGFIGLSGFIGFRAYRVWGLEYERGLGFIGFREGLCRA